MRRKERNKHTSICVDSISKWRSCFSAVTSFLCIAFIYAGIKYGCVFCLLLVILWSAWEIWKQNVLIGRKQEAPMSRQSIGFNMNVSSWNEQRCCRFLNVPPCCKIYAAPFQPLWLCCKIIDKRKFNAQWFPNKCVTI